MFCPFNINVEATQGSPDCRQWCELDNKTLASSKYPSTRCTKFPLKKKIMYFVSLGKETILKDFCLF